MTTTYELTQEQLEQLVDAVNLSNLPYDSEFDITFSIKDENEKFVLVEVGTALTDKTILVIFPKEK